MNNNIQDLESREQAIVDYAKNLTTECEQLRILIADGEALLTKMKLADFTSQNFLSRQEFNTTRDALADKLQQATNAPVFKMLAKIGARK